jgi:adenylyltransferase/sulfurtransferase
LGIGASLLGRLLLFNALDMKFRELKLRRDPQCPVCGEKPTITELIDYEAFCGLTPPPAPAEVDPDEVSVHDMKRALDAPALGIKVVDVREPEEHTIAHVPGVTLIPLSVLDRRFTELDPNQEYYLHCRSGVRSMRAVHFLREHGFKRVKNVKGGILAWSQEIDPSVPTY